MFASDHGYLIEIETGVSLDDATEITLKLKKGADEITLQNGTVKDGTITTAQFIVEDDSIAIGGGQFEGQIKVVTPTSSRHGRIFRTTIDRPIF